MTDPNVTAGRILALRAAATTTPAEVRELIESHLNAYSAEDARIVMGVALETVIDYLVRPSVAESADPEGHRDQFRTAADRIAVGPTEGE